MNTKSRYPMYVLIFLIIIFMLMIFTNLLASSSKIKNDAAQNVKSSSIIRKDQPRANERNENIEPKPVENKVAENFQNQDLEEFNVTNESANISSDNSNVPKRPEVYFYISSSAFDTFNTDSLPPEFSLSDTNKENFAVLKNIDDTRLLLLLFSRKPELVWAYEIEHKDKKAITPVSLSYAQDGFNVSFSVSDDDIEYDILFVKEENTSGGKVKYVEDGSEIENYRLVSYPNKIPLPSYIITNSFNVGEMNYYIVLDIPDLNNITEETKQLHFDAYLYQGIQNKLYCRQKLFSSELWYHEDIDIQEVVDYDIEDNGYWYFSLSNDAVEQPEVKISESELSKPPKSYSGILLLESKFNNKVPSYPIRIVKKYK